MIPAHPCLARLVFRAVEMVLVRVLTVEGFLASDAGLLEGCLGGGGRGGGFGSKDLFVKRFLGYWR